MTIARRPFISENNIKDVICTFPWEMYSIDTGFGVWRPCPRIDYLKVEDKEFNNHKRLIELRKNLRSGVKDPLCNKCWDDQEQGVKSYRQVLKVDHAPHNVESDKIRAPKIFEIKFSNLCNLKCVFCSSLCSSLWEQDIPVPSNQIGPIRGNELSSSCVDFFRSNFDDIEVIQIFGGEPLLHPEFYEIMDYILEKKSSKMKTISFSTNFYFPKNVREKFERYCDKLLKQGHKFYLRISIDGVFEKGEYLRTGLKWENFDQNFKSFEEKFGQAENFGRLRCNIALNALNLLSLHEIMKYINDSKFDFIEPHYNYIGKPERFMMKSYGKKLAYAKEQILTQNFYSYEQYKKHVLELIDSIISLEPNHTSIADCKKWLIEYDGKTGKSFQSTFPENDYLFS